MSKLFELISKLPYSWPHTQQFMPQYHYNETINTSVPSSAELTAEIQCADDIVYIASTFQNPNLIAIGMRDHFKSAMMQASTNKDIETAKYLIFSYEAYGKYKGISPNQIVLINTHPAANPKFSIQYDIMKTY